MLSSVQPRIKCSGTTGISVPFSPWPLVVSFCCIHVPIVCQRQSLFVSNTLKIMHIFYISSKTNVSHWFFFLWNLSYLLRAIVHFLTNLCILQSKIPMTCRKHLPDVEISGRFPGTSSIWSACICLFPVLQWASPCVWPLLKSNFCQSIPGRLDSPGLLCQCQVLDTRSVSSFSKMG